MVLCCFFDNPGRPQNGRYGKSVITITNGRQMVALIPERR
jgi:hypothetical protein